MQLSIHSDYSGLAWTQEHCGDTGESFAKAEVSDVYWSFLICKSRDFMTITLVRHDLHLVTVHSLSQPSSNLKLYRDSSSDFPRDWSEVYGNPDGLFGIFWKLAGETFLFLTHLPWLYCWCPHARTAGVTIWELTEPQQSLQSTKSFLQNRCRSAGADRATVVLLALASSLHHDCISTRQPLSTPFPCRWHAGTLLQGPLWRPSRSLCPLP